MRLLVDQDVYAATVRHLLSLGHDVVTVARLQVHLAADEAILKKGAAEGRVVVTRDRDFGSLVFLGGRRGGVIYLRVSPGTLEAVHDELTAVFSHHSQDDLLRSFIVVEPGRHRVRKLPDTAVPMNSD
ncbi:MAG: DUF5615 family PIN-like protein [Deltaproteobacteria bacterium]|nr:DUF5615 family PIN-like protein [Deltaproteobacteria bacterium]